MKRELEEAKSSLEPATKIIPIEEAKGTIPSETPAQNLNRDRSKKKQKLIMIVGYNGLDFVGSQKQLENVRTVEGEVERTLYEQGFIAESNYGSLKKICFSRATRTDKRVHALQNFFACKFLLDPLIKDLNIYKKRINNALPKDIRLFTLIVAAKKFNTKLRCSSREYLYYLPSFCLSKEKTILEELYKYKATPELLERLGKMCEEFKGTHRYHNYTRNMDPKKMQANRHIFELRTKPSLTIDGVEFIEFFINGQSFLYNQIRKMIGMFISLCRKNRPIEDIQKSFKKDEKMYIPLAPGEGLMLNRVLYDGYNKTKANTTKTVVVHEEDNAEVEKFKSELIECIGKQEMEKKVFSNWLKEFDENEAKHQEKDEEYAEAEESQNANDSDN